MPKFAAIGRSSDVCPGILIEEDDLNSHLPARGDRVFELLRRAETRIGVVQGEVAILASNLPSCQLNSLDSPSLARFRVLGQIFVWKGQPVFGRVNLNLLPGMDILHPLW